MFVEFSSKKILVMCFIVGLLSLGLFLWPLYEKPFHLNIFNKYKTQLILSLETLKYRFAYAEAAGQSGLAGIFGFGSVPSGDASGSARAIPVLLYHGVGNAQAEGDAPGAVPLANFQDQMFALKRAGYQTVRMEDLEAFLKGERQLPDRSFVLTFDDGRKDGYYPVDPILRALHYNAVNFIITRFSLSEDTKYYLNEDEIREMIKSGHWEIESHGKEDHTFYAIDDTGSHGLFLPNKLWRVDQGRLENDQEFQARIEGDLSTSRDELEKAFGVPVRGFAYPYSDYGQGSKNFPDAATVVPQAVRVLYPMAFYQVWTGNDFAFNYPLKDEFAVKRIEVGQYWSGEELLYNLETARERSLPYRNTFSSDRGWITNWGEAYVKDNTFIVSASPSTTGSTVFLEGTYSWRNYIFDAHVQQSQGRSVALIARFQDSKNYVACNYTSGLLHIDQVVGGNSRTIKGEKLTDQLPYANYDIGIQVHGRTVSCFLGGNMIIETPYLDESLNVGGVGMKVWDPELGFSRLVVDKVNVTAAAE